MTTCSVLRCEQPHGNLLTLDVGGRVEATLCDEHTDAMNRGERWRWAFSQNAILMGADLTGDGAIEAAEFKVGGEPSYDTLLGKNYVTLELSTSEPGEVHTIRIPAPAAVNLARALGFITAGAASDGASS